MAGKEKGFLLRLRGVHCVSGVSARGTEEVASVVVGHHCASSWVVGYEGTKCDLTGEVSNGLLVQPFGRQRTKRTLRPATSV